ncbi:hypothetical protein CJ030_MR0G008003 [Morella rubra]|uniref:Retrotransposon gag domain-containing protein n=1 Tax=Morella rubra TaxID=262757 RepID=A0A6A1UK02_9ROSI|nr:hypothetical protein CJ030_MR0G008003 [Morella rubra]
MMHQVESPFTSNILEVRLPSKFRMLVIDRYTGVTDPLDHLEGYRSQMDLLDTQNAIKCKAFPITVAGSARIWFSRLRRNFISSFKELSRAFISHFIASKSRRSQPLISSPSDKRKAKVCEIM